MLNLSRYSNNSDGFCDYDLKGLRHSQVEKNRLPRHISSLESRKHRKTANSNRLAASSSSSIQQKKTKQVEQSNLAVNILTYQLKDHAAQQKHLANIRSNLQHRFEVAKAAQDSQLMTMLQEEFRQLPTI